MTSRQEVYDRIRNSSKDEVILEEMIRLGFWRRGGTLPEDPAEEIREFGELERQMRALTSENSRLQNAAALKKALRLKRLEESKRKRAANKEKRLRERAERAAAWKAKQLREITYLGQAVSQGLGDNETNEQKLASNHLPIIRNAEELAQAMGVTVSSIRFLAFNRRTSKSNHYRRFAIRKKTGETRKISAPMPRLKKAQYWIHECILSRVELHQNAHGFRPGRSIVTNATPHVGSQIVVNMDLRDFFPSVSYRRVKGMFRSLGYSEAIATILALICSEPDVSEVRMDGRTYYVAQGERKLPQGAPTSPVITNIICRGMDARLTHIATALGGVYTRYADDLTFSFKDGSANIGTLLRQVNQVVCDESFTVHPDKTRVQRVGSHQEVTGLTVNERVSVPRQRLRQFRAALFQIEKDGPAGKKWGRSNDVIAAIEGFANFVKMVEPKKGAALFDRVQLIINKHGRGYHQRQQRQRWQDPLPPIIAEVIPQPGAGARQADGKPIGNTEQAPTKPTSETNNLKTSPNHLLQPFNTDTDQAPFDDSNSSKNLPPKETNDGADPWWKFW